MRRFVKLRTCSAPLQSRFRLALVSRARDRSENVQSIQRPPRTPVLKPGLFEHEPHAANWTQDGLREVLVALRRGLVVISFFAQEKLESAIPQHHGSLHVPDIGMMDN